MTTFFLAALDERVRASAPVSGTLSTKGWVVQRLSAAHCDCQYPVNNYALMYSEIGALTAPRAQLVCNANADRGFPQDSVHEMVEKMRGIYRLYGAADALQMAIVPGGHGDTEAIRLPVYRFFVKELLGQDMDLATEGTVELPPDQNLVCFRDGLPLDERLTRSPEQWIPQPDVSGHLSTVAGRTSRIQELTDSLRSEVFRYFPGEPALLESRWGEPTTELKRVTRSVTFQAFEGLPVHGVLSLPAGPEPLVRLPAVLVVDHRKGIRVWGNEQRLELHDWGARAVLLVETVDIGSRALEQNLRSFQDDDLLHHLKREAMVMGTTLESMQVYELLRSLALLRSRPEVDPANITIVGRGATGINGVYAALLDGNVARVVVASPPASHREGPCYLGILRYTDIPEVLGAMHGRIRLYGEIPLAFPAYFAAAGLDKTIFVDSLEEGLR